MRLEHKSENNSFEQIYQAAKLGNDAKLKEALLIAYIDVHDSLMTPVAKLAAEKHIKAVNFLLQHGASLANAAYGYALGGHWIEALQILKNVKLSNNSRVADLVLENMIFGFAQRGDWREAIKLCGMNDGLDGEMIFTKKDGKSIFTKKEQLAAVGKGLAAGKFKQEAFIFLEDIKKADFQEKICLAKVVDGIAEGLGLAGCKTEEVSVFLQSFTLEKDHDLWKYKNALVRVFVGLALGGHEQEIHNLLLSVGEIFADFQKESSGSLPSIYTSIARFLAIGGHKTQAYNLLAKIKKNYSGNIYEIGMFTFLVCGFIQGGHKREAYQLLDEFLIKYPSRITYFLLDFVAYEKELGYCFDKDVLLEILTKMDNHDLRVTLARDIKDGINDYDVEPLILKAEKLSKLINNFYLTYSQALKVSILMEERNFSLEKALAQICNGVIRSDGKKEAIEIGNNSRGLFSGNKSALAMKELIKVQTRLICPITQEIMSDPVILLQTGKAYERSAIEEWLKKNNNEPFTNKELKDKTLIPDEALKELCFRAQRMQLISRM